MSTTAEKLWEATRTLPEFLRTKRGVVDDAEPSPRLAALGGGLEASASFCADPLTIQRQLRDEWH
jgi:hypothetical protein